MQPRIYKQDECLMNARGFSLKVPFDQTLLRFHAVGAGGWEALDRAEVERLVFHALTWLKRTEGMVPCAECPKCGRGMMEGDGVCVLCKAKEGIESARTCPECGGTVRGTRVAGDCEGHER